MKKSPCIVWCVLGCVVWGSLAYAQKIPERLEMGSNQKRVVDFQEVIARAVSGSTAVGAEVSTDRKSLTITARKKGEAEVSYELQAGKKGVLVVIVDGGPPLPPPSSVDKVEDYLKGALRDVVGTRMSGRDAFGRVVVTGKIVSASDWNTYRDCLQEVASQGLSQHVKDAVVYELDVDAMRVALERRLAVLGSGLCTVKAEVDHGQWSVALRGLIDDAQTQQALTDAVSDCLVSGFGIAAKDVKTAAQFCTLADAGTKLTDELMGKQGVLRAKATLAVSGGADRPAVSVDTRILAAGSQPEAGIEADIKKRVAAFGLNTLGLPEQVPLAVAKCIVLTPSIIEENLGKVLGTLKALLAHETRTVVADDKLQVRVRGQVCNPEAEEAVRKAIDDYLLGVSWAGVTVSRDISVADDYIDVELIRYVLSDTLEKEYGTDILRSLTLDVGGSLTSMSGAPPLYELAANFNLQRVLNVLRDEGVAATTQTQTAGATNCQEGHAFSGTTLLVRVSGQDGATDVKEVPVGFDVHVTPTMLSKDTVRLDLSVEVRSVTSKDPRTGDYEISTASSKTRVETPLNGTVGLAVNKLAYAASGRGGVPILRSLPGVGLLFGPKTKEVRYATQILVAIPRVKGIDVTEDPTVWDATREVIEEIRQKLEEGERWR